jgi:hypothetical protein
LQPVGGECVSRAGDDPEIAAVRLQLEIFVIAGAERTEDSAFPPETIEPDGAVTVKPLPLSVAKPIRHPALTALGAGNVTASEAPGAL